MRDYFRRFDKFMSVLNGKKVNESSSNVFRSPTYFRGHYLMFFSEKKKTVDSKLLRVDGRPLLSQRGEILVDPLTDKIWGLKWICFTNTGN
jgi:hypothetical protein